MVTSATEDVKDSVQDNEPKETKDDKVKDETEELKEESQVQEPVSEEELYPKEESDDDEKTEEPTDLPSEEVSSDTPQKLADDSKTSLLTVDSKTSMSTGEDVMEESHGSGDLSDSNRTITADDNESDIDEPSEDHSSGTELKDTDSNRDRSSSIQSITEPSLSPQDQSPETVRARLAGGMSSSGYVKNMLEEAMVESQKDTDSHTDSSDLVPIDHNSETSSDIEIISHISTPSNGDYQRPFDLSPLRHALSRSMTRPQGHNRSDSGSSGMSLQSGNGHDITSPPGMMRHPEPPLALLPSQERTPVPVPVGE